MRLEKMSNALMKPYDLALHGVKTAERVVILWTETAQLSFLPRYFSYSQPRSAALQS
jgi:hypothetical protein